MANFMIVVDPNPEQRSHFIKTIRPLISPVEDLIVNHCTTTNFCAIWAANTHAPISYVSDEEGAAVVWGEAIEHYSSGKINALQLRNLWKDSGYQKLPTFDGFYASVLYHPQWGITVAADLLGLFPVYYYTESNVILIASSPELFRYHPCFHSSFNPAGLVGILLTNGIFNGQTLWTNIRRLDPGNLLVFQPGNTPQEIQQYTIPYPGEASANLTFTEQVDNLDQVLEQVIQRHVDASKRHSLLLSGGLDSRMLAGFLHRQNVDTVALTLGVASDLEMKCAVPVARTLGFPHYMTTVPFEQYPICTQQLVKWEHLANGFNGVMGWGTYSDLSPLASRAIAGYLLDLMIGPKKIYNLEANDQAFTKYFADVSQWAFTPQLLKPILRKEIFGDLVDDTLGEIKQVYENYADTTFKRSRYFELYHRYRFHVGSSAWRMSFGAWPVLPALDWELLKHIMTVPMEVIGKRKAQIQLVCTRFPQLAQLPLDRNGYNVEPLQPTQIRQLLAPLFIWQRNWRKLQQKLGYERRYYYRVYDINNPGWQAVRQQVEANRECLEYLFQPEILNQFLPPANTNIQSQSDRIIASSSLKILLGLSLWVKEYL